MDLPLSHPSKERRSAMEAAAYRPCVLAEVDPHVEWVRGDGFDTLLVDVSGFSREQLKVQVEPSGSLRISGERALDGGRQWCHFLMRLDVLAAGEAARDAAAIKAVLDRGVLHVQVPRRLFSSSAAADAGYDDSDQQQQVLLPDRYGDGEEVVDAPREDGEGSIWSGGHTAAWRRGDGRRHQAWRVAARSLREHRHVVLNVLLAVVLLWLVAFGKSGGQTGNE